MAIGLTGFKNLSERNLNLKTALQKLYAPGIETDIELFSLSSSVESLLLSGAPNDFSKQILGLSSEQILLISGAIQKRTKFLTRSYTLTDGNRVFFTNFGVQTGFGTDVYEPIFSRNGSIADISIISGGGGFYLTELDGTPINLEGTESFVLENVPLSGVISGRTSARATVTFQKQFLPGRDATYTNPAPAGGGSGVVIVSITLNGHGLSTGDAAYIRFQEGPAIGLTGAYYSVTRVDDNVFTISGNVASIASTPQSCIVTPLEEVERYTPGLISRYSIQSIELVQRGSDYVINENLTLVGEQTGTRLQIIESGQPTTRQVRLYKQSGNLFFGQPEILRTKQYEYVVRGADAGGFFLYDIIKEKYIFLDKNIPTDPGFSSQELNSISLRRFDGINIFNLLQFKFSQSRIWVRNLSDFYAIEGEPVGISDEINAISNSTGRLRSRMESGVQNTVRPTPANSPENILGYKYNSFVGQDVVIWQRVVMRDQDYLLDPSAPGITGLRLKQEVENFRLLPENKKIPGLFIKVGQNYIRAFSSTDKPFLKEQFNPRLTAGSSRYALSAEDSQIPEPTTPANWYAYDSEISDLAQRIDSQGVNGAFYFHRPSPPQIRTVSATPNRTVYAVPLFQLI